MIRHLKRTGENVFVILVGLFMLVPLVVVVAQGFTRGQQVQFPPNGFSLHWLEQAMQTPQFTQGLGLSVKIALGVAIIGGIVGAAVAFAVHWYDFPGKRALETFILSPLSIPAIGLGIALLSIESLLGLVGNVYVLLLAHLMIAIAFVLRLTGVGITHIDRNAITAAGTLGARPWTVFWRVTFPQFASSLAVGCIFAFVVSFDEIGISLFLAAPGSTTFPVALFTYMEENYNPLVMAAGTLLLLFSIVPLAIVSRVVGLARVLGLDD
jgi:putative spermidine/putrescine transport system permease protein